MLLLEAADTGSSFVSRQKEHVAKRIPIDGMNINEPHINWGIVIGHSRGSNAYPPLLEQMFKTLPAGWRNRTRQHLCYFAEQFVAFDKEHIGDGATRFIQMPLNNAEAGSVHE